MSVETKAFPQYPTKHSGPALVIGSGPDAYEGMALAKERLSLTPYVIAVNHMVNLVACSAMVTCHPEAFGQLDTIVHYYPSDQRKAKKKPSNVDFIWRGPPAGSGSSSLCAVLTAKGMGFEEIILCGVPLTKTGYVDGYPRHSEFNNNPNGKVMNSTVLQRRETWSKFHKAGKLNGVTSFSGFTRELLGEPQFQKELA